VYIILNNQLQSGAHWTASVEYFCVADLFATFRRGATLFSARVNVSPVSSESAAFVASMNFGFCDSFA
jgi:hypothetical protein